MTPVQVKLGGSPEALWARREEWNALVSRSATDTVFQTLEWQASWWRAFGAGARPLVLLAESAERLVGIAPLMLVERRILGRKRRVVEFIGTHAADYADFIAERSHAEAVPCLLAWLRAHAGQWDLLHLINIADTSPLLEQLPAAFTGGRYAVEVSRLYECPTRVLGNREEDERAARKRSVRADLRKLRARGEVGFEAHVAAPEIESRLEAFFDQHVARWAGTDTPSFFLDPRQRAFYRELTARLAPRGWVLFTAVSFRGKPISLHFGFHYGERVFVIKPTFDPAFSQYAPGLIQISWLLEYAMRQGAKELDFTIGEEAYKYRFANRARVNYAARVHDRALFYGIDRLLARSRAAVKRSPAVTGLAKRLLKPLLGRTLQRLGL